MDEDMVDVDTAEAQRKLAELGQDLPEERQRSMQRVFDAIPDESEF